MKTVDVLALEYGLDKVHATELYNLIKEISNKGFTCSSSLSNYIKNNKLGNKYPNISGIVKMQKNGDAWDFEGGFPSNIYRIVCTELNLQNKQSGAIATGFTSYRDLDKDKSSSSTQTVKIRPVLKRDKPN